VPQTGTTSERGYGPDHQRERERWRPYVERGETYCHAAVCLMASRWIAPGTRWHLGHNTDRTAWTGPEHERCNVTDGAIRGNHARRHHQPTAQPRHPVGW
jgi:hypothetical protein